MSISDIISAIPELLLHLLQFIFHFFINSANIFIQPIINKINLSLPNIDNAVQQINSALGLAQQYIGYILDFLLISSPVLLYLISSIIFRVIIRANTYFTKITLQWYEKLVP